MDQAFSIFYMSRIPWKMNLRILSLHHAIQIIGAEPICLTENGRNKIQKLVINSNILFIKNFMLHLCHLPASPFRHCVTFHWSVPWDPCVTQMDGRPIRVTLQRHLVSSFRCCVTLHWSVPWEPCLQRWIGYFPRVQIHISCLVHVAQWCC